MASVFAWEGSAASSPAAYGRVSQAAAPCPVLCALSVWGRPSLPGGTRRLS